MWPEAGSATGAVGIALPGSAVGESTHPTIAISGSLAFDYIMTYPGSFLDHIIPDKVSVLSVSFLFDTLRRQRGGVAGNIGYNLALLGERPALVGGGGSDFGEYRATFDLLGIDMTHVLDVPEELTGSAFMNADLEGNQIAGFYPGASVVADQLSVSELGRHAVFGIVGPTTLEAMRRHAREFGDAACRLIYDPSQQVVSLSGEDLDEGIDRAWGVIGSDYELAVIGQKTGLAVEQIAERTPFVVVTLGKFGSKLYLCGEEVIVPAAPPTQLGEPTGGGDAYRGGLLKGLLLGLPLEIAGRMGSLAATYAIELHGTQAHVYTAEEFVTRFDGVFPGFAGAIEVKWLQEPVAKEQAVERLSGLAARGDEDNG